MLLPISSSFPCHAVLIPKPDMFILGEFQNATVDERRSSSHKVLPSLEFSKGLE